MAVFFPTSGPAAFSPWHTDGSLSICSYCVMRGDLSARLGHYPTVAGSSGTVTGIRLPRHFPQWAPHRRAHTEMTIKPGCSGNLGGIGWPNGRLFDLLAKGFHALREHRSRVLPRAAELERAEVLVPVTLGAALPVPECAARCRAEGQRSVSSAMASFPKMAHQVLPGLLFPGRILSWRLHIRRIVAGG